MRHKRLQLSAVLLFGLGLTGLQAQESVNTSGGNASGSGGSVSYSYGQMVYQTHTGTNGSVAEGVQQAYEISVLTGIDGAKEIKLLVSAYPNPTTDYLTLSISEFDVSDLSYLLFDMNGKLIQNEKISGSQTSIFMGNLVPASYLVRVIQKNEEVKTFKIIKK
ncbi:T9SS type A sorting domain-containing protein [Maribellus comscasis]|uniref:T9SS type A sorting domain-containing protein n=1 Tax=Maribellus comscasis TaxID=2681766 RepID=A0A6I6JLP7_9BACT|nr:T9SS type A sorting domain-containing protein [Maribellus comscasis]QGY43756.1 T9SS type A sorting domain-containing protein [Maribellus comscasis]